MNADEQFEKLGYVKNEIYWEEDNQLHFISYSSHDTTIDFDLDSKYIDSTNIITLIELQVIYKKVNELGWF